MQAYCGIVTSHTSLQSMFVQESKGLKELQEVSYHHKFLSAIAVDSTVLFTCMHSQAYNLHWHATDVYRMTDLIKECNMQLTPSNTHFVPLPPSSLQKGQIEVVTHVQWSKQSVQYTTQTHHMPQHTDLLLAGTGWHKYIDKVTIEPHSEGQLSWTMRNS